MDPITSQFNQQAALGFSNQMSQLEKARLGQEVNTFNKAQNNGKIPEHNLGKDDFLKILITQLSTQDPTDPMKDKDFIAQMAQFSSLEQMTNMATNFSKVTSVISSSQAVSTLGKGVEIQTANQTIRGTVDEVTPGAYPQVKVDGKYYDYSQVQKIFPAEAN
jgi:flagellar basal-body rod modification protein FlgD